MNFHELENKIAGAGKRKLAVVGAHERNVLAAVARAARAELVEPVLFGNADVLRSESEASGVQISDWEIHDVRDDEAIVFSAMAMVRERAVDAIMKGTVATPTLMRVGLKNGLKREGRLLTHLAFMESSKLNRFIVLTDSGIIPYPNLQQRVAIIKNAVEALRAIDIEQPKVALLSSSEAVDEKLPCSVDAQKLTSMNRAGGALANEGVIAGPMDFWCAVDPKTAAAKGLDNPVAGRADIIHCPDVVSGNMLGKAASFFADDLKIGGCVVGGAVPICLLSRASSVDDKYFSILSSVACQSGAAGT